MAVTRKNRVEGTYIPDFRNEDVQSAFSNAFGSKLAYEKEMNRMQMRNFDYVPTTYSAKFNYNMDKATDEMYNLYASNGNGAIDMVHRDYMDYVMSLATGDSLETVREKHNSYASMFTGKPIEAKDFNQAFWDSWDTYSLGKDIAHMQVQYDLSSDPDERKRLLRDIAEKEKKVVMKQDYSARNNVENNFIGAAPIMAQTTEALAWEIAGSVAGGLLFGGLGALATEGVNAAKTSLGMLNKAKALYGASKALRSSMALGGFVAQGANLLDSVFVTEAGSMSRELYNMVDEDGKRLEDYARIFWSTLYGAVATAEEVATPGIDFNFSKAFSQQERKLIKRFTKRFFTSFTIDAIRLAANETVEEVLQGLTSDIIKDWSKHEANELEENRFNEEELGKMLNKYLENGVNTFAETYFPSLFAMTGGNVIKTSVGSFGRETIKLNNEMSIGKFDEKAQAKVNEVQKDSVSSYTVDIRAVKLKNKPVSSENKARIKEMLKKGVDENGNEREGMLPPVKVKYNEESGMLEPIDKWNEDLAKYLYNEYQDAVKIERVSDTTYADEDTIDSMIRDASSYSDDKKVALLGMRGEGDDVIYASNSEGVNTIIRMFSPFIADVTTDAEGNTVVSLNYEANANPGNVTQRKVTIKNAETVKVDNTTIKEALTKAVLLTGNKKIKAETIEAYGKLFEILPKEVQEAIIAKADSRGLFQSGIDDEVKKLFPGLYGKDGKAINRGAADLTRGIIALTNASDASTVFHEGSHIVLSVMPEARKNLSKAFSEVYANPEEKAKLVKFFKDNNGEGQIFQTLFNKDVTPEQLAEYFSNIDPDGNWTEEQEEIITIMNENYPTISRMLDKLPKKIADVLREVARLVRDVYSRWYKDGNNSVLPEAIDKAFAEIYADHDSWKRENITNSDGNIVNQTPTKKLSRKQKKEAKKKDALSRKVKYQQATQRADENPQIEEIRQKYEGTVQWMKAPNGKDSNLDERQWCMVRTDAFKEWFGDWENDQENASKVVDENGEPLVVYHGTTREFNEFMAEFVGRTGYPDTLVGEAYFFSTSRLTALTVASTGEEIGKEHAMEVFLNIRNSGDFDPSRWGEEDYIDTRKMANLIEMNKSVDKDGTLWRSKSMGDTYVVFNPNNIKSATDNNGYFSTGNNDIRYQQQTTDQVYSSKNTSVIGQIPSGYSLFTGKGEPNKNGFPKLSKLIKDKFGKDFFVRGSVNFELGAGQSLTSSRYLRDNFGVRNIPTDYSWYSARHNEDMATKWQGKCDTVTAMNVINVIDGQIAREILVANAGLAIKPDGIAVFQVYKKRGDGVGEATGGNKYQNNMDAKSHIETVEKYFDHVEYNGDYIIAENPKYESIHSLIGNKMQLGGSEHPSEVLTNGKNENPEEYVVYQQMISDDDVGKPFKNVNGSRIGRSPKHPTGKWIGGQLYVHKDYAPDDVKKLIADGKKHLPDGFTFNTVMFDTKKPNMIRFDEAPDFDTAREPIPGDMYTVNTDTGEVRKSHSDMIWHHKWEWVGNDYKGFNVKESYAWSNMWASKIDNISGIGSMRIWNERLREYGLPIDDISDEIDEPSRDVVFQQLIENADKNVANVKEAFRLSGIEHISNGVFDISVSKESLGNPTDNKISDSPDLISAREEFARDVIKYQQLADKQMRILVACEESQEVTKVLRELGHVAYSCDLQETSGDHVEWHIQGDALALLNGKCSFTTADGMEHSIDDRWDMIIGFPPCTHLAVSGARHFEQKRLDGRQLFAIDFFSKIMNADCDKIAIENPINIIGGDYIKKWYPDYAYMPKADQVIQPYYFGDKSRKATNLWLKNLPKLEATDIVEPELETFVNKDGKKYTYTKGFSSMNAKQRSKTYPGVARAIGEQWAGQVPLEKRVMYQQMGDIGLGNLKEKHPETYKEFINKMYIGADGKPRYELIDDIDKVKVFEFVDRLRDGKSSEDYCNSMIVQLNGGDDIHGGRVPLTSMIDSPILFDAYPQLKEVYVSANSSAAMGEWVKNENTIYLDGRILGDDGAELLADALDYDAELMDRFGAEDFIKSILLHEVQHAIQTYEGLEDFSSDEALQYRKNYFNTAVEVEARLTQHRALLRDWDTNPVDDMDVPMYDNFFPIDYHKLPSDRLPSNIKWGININDGSFDFTGFITDGIKDIETRNSDVLSHKDRGSLVGKQVALVSTGHGKAYIVGYVTISGMKEYNSVEEFRADENRHLVREGSPFDITKSKNGKKVGYVLQHPVKLDTPIPVESWNGSRSYRPVMPEYAGLKFQQKINVDESRIEDAESVLEQVDNLIEDMDELDGIGNDVAEIEMFSMDIEEGIASFSDDLERHESLKNRDLQRAKDKLDTAIRRMESFVFNAEKRLSTDKKYPKKKKYAHNLDWNKFNGTYVNKLMNKVRTLREMIDNRDNEASANRIKAGELSATITELRNSLSDARMARDNYKSKYAMLNQKVRSLQNEIKGYKIEERETERGINAALGQSSVEPDFHKNYISLVELRKELKDRIDSEGYSNTRKSFLNIPVEDIRSMISEGIYVPTELMEHFKNELGSAYKQEMQDREAMKTLSSKVKAMAISSMTSEEFIESVKEEVFGGKYEQSTKMASDRERILEKYWNYVHTPTSQDMVSNFKEQFNDKDSLLALRSMIYERRVTRADRRGKLWTKVTRNGSRKAMMLANLNENSSDAEVNAILADIDSHPRTWYREYLNAKGMMEDLGELRYSEMNPDSYEHDKEKSSFIGDSAYGRIESNEKKVSKASLRTKAEKRWLSMDKYDNEFIRSISALEDDGSINREHSVPTIMKELNCDRETAGKIKIGLNRISSKDLIQNMNNLTEEFMNSAFDTIRGELDQDALRQFLMKQVTYYINGTKRRCNLNTNTHDVKIAPTLKWLGCLIKGEPDGKKFYQRGNIADYVENLGERLLDDEEREVREDVITLFPLGDQESARKSLSVEDEFKQTMEGLDFMDDEERTETRKEAFRMASENEQKFSVNIGEFQFNRKDMPSELRTLLSDDAISEIEEGGRYSSLSISTLGEIYDAIGILRSNARQTLSHKKESHKMRVQMLANQMASRVLMAKDINDVALNEEDVRKALKLIGEEYIENATPEEERKQKAKAFNYIMKHPSMLFEEKERGDIGKMTDMGMTSFLKIQRVARYLDGKEDGPIYNAFVKDVFKAYQDKLRKIAERKAYAEKMFNKPDVLGDPKTEEGKSRRSYMENKSKFMKNNGYEVELSGWEQLGVWLYSQNIHGFEHLVSTNANNLTLDAIASINPEAAKKFAHIYVRIMEPDMAEDITYIRNLREKCGNTKSIFSDWQNNIGREILAELEANKNRYYESAYENFNVLMVSEESYFPIVYKGRIGNEEITAPKQTNTSFKGSAMNNRTNTRDGELELNAIATYISTIENQEHAINMTPSLMTINSILNPKGGNLANVVSNRKGSEYAKYLREFVKRMAGEEVRIQDLDRLMNRFMGGIAASKLGLNVMTSFKQLLSIIPAVTQGEINGADLIRGIAHVGLFNNQITEELKELAPEIMQGSLNIEVAQSKARLEGKMVRDAMDKLQEVSMWPVEATDHWAKKIIFYASYLKNMDNGMSQSDAAFKASQLIQTTQSISDPISLAPLQTRKDFLSRLFWMFTNDSFQMWNVIYGDAILGDIMSDRNYMRAFERFVGVFMTASALALLSGGWLPDKEDEGEEFDYRRLARDISINTLGYLVPIGGHTLDEYVTNWKSDFWGLPRDLFETVRMFDDQVIYKNKEYSYEEWIAQCAKLGMDATEPLGNPRVFETRLWNSTFSDGITEGVVFNPAYLLGKTVGDGVKALLE